MDGKTLIIFAKEPLTGKVKTRMSGFFSPDQCVALYKGMLSDTVRLSLDVECERTIIAYRSEGEPSYIKSMAEGMELYEQDGRDLGERMLNAIIYASGNEYIKTVVIGSDSPTLPVFYINRAYALLDSCDIVLGPTFDGGYYLIGCKSPSKDIFEGIEWSSDKVLSETLKRSCLSGKKVALLNKWYDVDTPDDLERLRSDIEKRDSNHCCPGTEQFLRTLRTGPGTAGTFNKTHSSLE